MRVSACECVCMCVYVCVCACVRSVYVGMVLPVRACRTYWLTAAQATKARVTGGAEGQKNGTGRAVLYK